jgi:ribosomal protein S18 acetylase RimI-like enzyme
MRVQIRPATPDDADRVAAIHVAAWEGAYRGIMPDAEFAKRPLARRQQQWREWLRRDDRITLIACTLDGEVLGFAGGWELNARETGFDSYLATLYLRPDVKRRGIGTQLLRAFASELLERDARTMVLRTLRLGPGRAFYERLGARLIPEGIGFEAGTFDDVVYVFDDLNALAASIPRPSEACARRSRSDTSG